MSGIEVFCLTCATAAPAGARFCGQCGTPLPVHCPACKEPADAGTAYCTVCGTALAAAPVPGRGLPGPGVERRLVSVLAVDIVGFSTMSTTLDPEDLHTAQQLFFDLVTTAVTGAGGTVVKRMGDAILAVFGVPITYDNDAYRAVRAGLQVQRDLSGRMLADGRPLLARAAVVTGEALVTFDEEPTVAGDLLPGAMSLQQTAPPGGVVVADATYRRTALTIDYAPAEGAAGDEVHVALSLARRPEDIVDVLPQVGRESELGLLVGALRRVLSERHGHFVLLVGEPGLGKSRLTRALQEHVVSPATPTLIRWRVGYCPSYGEGSSYAALAEIVRSQAGILDSDNPAVARAKLDESVGALLRHDPVALEQMTPRLAALLGLPGHPGSLSDTSDDLAASHSVWRRYLLALAADNPTVLVIEDLHWADNGLLDFLRSLMEHAGSVPLFVLTTTRPELFERRPDWVAGMYDAMTLTLLPLNPHELRTVLSRLVGAAPLPAALADRLLDLSAGVPLYVEEYVRMLIDSGALDVGGERVLAELPLPETVQGVVDSRLDLLTVAERTVVSAAAVVGERFWEDAVAAVADADRSVVLSCLEALEEREVVRRSPRSSMAGQEEFSFHHVLVREAAYGRIPRSLRVGQHQRCADWLDGLAGDGSDNVAELRAYHRSTAHQLAVEIGLDPETYAVSARQALTVAAERSLRLHAISTAHRYARRAAALWSTTPELPGALKAELLALEVGFLDDPDAFYDDAGPARAERTAALLFAAGDRAGAARAKILLGQAAWFSGSGVEVASAHLSRAVDWLAEEPASELFASALAELGRLKMLTQHYTDAIAYCDRAMAIARPLGLLEVEANALITAGSARYSTGDPLGLVLQEQALELCRAKGLRGLQRAANNLAATMQEEGRLRRSYELIEESSAASRGWGLSFTTRADHSETALMAWYDGDWLRMLDATDQFLAEVGTEARKWESHLLSMACVVRVMQGQPMPIDLDELVAQCRDSGFPSLLRSALAHQGGVRFLLGDLDGATAAFEELYEHTTMIIRGASREWLYPAVLLGSFVGRPQLTRMKDRLEALEPKTPWLTAATDIAASHLLNDEGKHLDALERVRSAVDTYQAIGDHSSVLFARIRLTRCAAAAGELVLQREQSALVRQFTGRVGAVLLEQFLPPD